ncbi:cation:proton antiporter [Nautilia sp. PV-1]|jgi:Kef-type K+ transport system membrane component KefB|uniref:cation:proton antiporter n=1 Tax=Nautilia sp. PV-1 TaxID=2579250 RepID=UPI000FDBE1BE|nr:cation:proton antiporter [Nautilia sp. PV-1]AZV45823.1 cation:proton antiporter [Nautilia sp. PV-1]
MSAEFLIISLSVILLISPFLSNILKLPISMVEITLGAVFSAVGLIHHNEMFNLLAEVGFLYLMLLAGMEVNLKDLLKMEKSLFKKGVLFLFILVVSSFIFVFLFSYSKVFLVIMPLISIGLMISIQQEIGKKEWLDLAIKIGVLGELISILILTVVSGYFEFGFDKKLLINIGILFLFLIFLVLAFFLIRAIFWWFPKLKHYLMPGVDKYHQDVRIAISFFFIMIAFLMKIHLDVVLGAFVVGVFIATFFEHNKDLEHKLAPFGFGFLITIFFVHVGSSLNLSLISMQMLKDSLMIVGVMILVRIFASAVFYTMLGIKKTLLFALSLSMPLTLLIATATLAHQNGTISDYWYNVLVFTAVLEVIIVMISVKIIEKKF